jgi:hypothetical protein
MQRDAVLVGARGRIDIVYLDTTYCHPKHVFPTQQASVAFIADAVTKSIHPLTPTLNPKP